MENALHRFHIDGDGAAVVAQSNNPPAKLLLMMGNGTGAAGKREILFFLPSPLFSSTFLLIRDAMMDLQLRVHKTI